MRKVTIQEMMTFFENNDIVHDSVVSVGKYLLARRYSVEEWVYVELP